MLLVQCLATAALSQNRLLHEWFHSTNYVYGTEIQTRKGFDGIDKITVQQFFVVVSYNSMGFNSYIRSAKLGHQIMPIRPMLIFSRCALKLLSNSRNE